MSSVPVDKRHHVLAFVALAHVEQKRKYTNEPYLSHLQAVAKMADGKCKFGYEIGLCHDLFEDTDILKSELFHALCRFGYDMSEANFISDVALELTDIYTPENYPNMNRLARKGAEAHRLHGVSYEAQTVKYCDLIHNTESIVKYDPGFAKKYVLEKEVILAGMNKGNKVIYRKALKSLEQAKKDLQL